MAQESRTQIKTYFQTGDVPTQAQFENLIESAYWYSDDDFANLAGLAWDGTNAYKTISANTALTLSSSRAGGSILIIQGGAGNYTLTVNGESITINTAVGSVSLVTFLKINGAYYLQSNNSLIAPDVTAPSLLTATVEDAAPANIVLTYNEDLDTASVPAVGAFTVPGKTVSAVDVTGAVVTVTVSVAFEYGDTPTISYTAGASPLQDAAGNDCANLTNQAVTNNISGTDADAQIYIDALIAAGESPTAPQQAAINTAFIDAKAAGLFDKRGGYYFPVWGSANASKINLKSPGTNDLDFSLDVSTPPTYGSSGVDGFAMINLNPPSMFADKDSASAFIYSQEAISGGAFQALLGFQDTTNGNTFGVIYTSGASPQGGLNSANGGMGTYTHVKGWNGLNRNNAANFQIVHNGTTGLNVTAASTAIPTDAGTGKFAFGNIRTDLATQPYELEHPWSFACWGEGLSAQELIDENAFVEALMDAFGIGQQ